MIKASIRKSAALFEAVTLSLITSALPMLAQSRDFSPNGDFSELAAAMQRRVDSGTPSIAIAVARHGKIVWEHAAGKSDIERQELATVNTPYYLASISKTITMTALMALAAKGKLDLDRPVNTYLRTA